MQPLTKHDNSAETSKCSKEVNRKMVPTSDVAVQTTQDLTAYTPRKAKLFSEKRSIQNQLSSAQKKLSYYEEPNAELELMNFLRLCDKFFPENTAMFIKQQALHLPKLPHGRRFSREFKRLCLKLYIRGPKSYKSLSSIFALPSRITLNRMLSNVILKCGVNDNIFSFLSVSVENMSEENRLCVLCFDEMAIKTHLYYDIKRDEVLGLEDFDGQSKTFHPARNACVFFARGISNWKQPVAFALSSSTTPSEVLHDILLQCIIKLKNIGIKVVAVTCDMGSANLQLSEFLQVTSSDPYFTIDEQKIIFCFDVPHLLKATRNMFLKNNFSYDEYSTDHKYVVDFYQEDSKLQRRLAPKLTNAHVSSNAFETMKVRFAAQLFSSTVAAAMTMYIHLKRLPDEAMGTIDFIDKMDKLFDILNSTNDYKGDKKFAHIFSGEGFQIEFLDECASLFEQLQVFNLKNQNVTNRMKFITCWKITIAGVKELWSILKSYGLTSLPTRRLNQDVAENFFGQVRSEGGNSFNPTSTHFYWLFRKLLCNNFFNSGNENCEEDFDSILLEADHFMQNNVVLHDDF